MTSCSCCYTAKAKPSPNREFVAICCVDCIRVLRLPEEYDSRLAESRLLFEWATTTAASTHCIIKQSPHNRVYLFEWSHKSDMICCVNYNRTCDVFNIRCESMGWTLEDALNGVPVNRVHWNDQDTELWLISCNNTAAIWRIPTIEECKSKKFPPLPRLEDVRQPRNTRFLMNTKHA